MTLENCRVVLVRTQLAANIGSTARVMRNMGVRQLVLVAPEASPTEHQARQLSTHGECILHEARIVSTLEDALSDCLLVAGTSARTGGLFRYQTVGTPDEVAPWLAEAARGGPVAVVFGPERDGLRNEEVTRCNYLVHIPADSAYPVLNLSHAVAICLYELRRAVVAGTETRSPRPGVPSDEGAPVPVGLQERMFTNLRTALEEIGFLREEAKADALMHAVRHLIGRARPSEMEVKILLGLARQMRWFVRHGPEGSPTEASEEPE